MAAGNVTPSDRDMADNMIGILKNISAFRRIREPDCELSFLRS